MLVQISQSTTTARHVLLGMGLIGIVTCALPTIWNPPIQAREPEPTAQSGIANPVTERTGGQIRAGDNLADSPPRESPTSPKHEPIVLSNCRATAADQVQLAAERPGVIAFVVKEGSKVKAGDKLATLRDDPVRIARLDVDEANAAVEIARLEHESAKLLTARNAIPSAELSLRRIAADRAKVQLDRAQAQLEAMIQALTISAPFDGTVTRVSKTKGQALQAGDPVVDLVSTKRVYVEGFVGLDQLPLIAAGAPVSVLPVIKGTVGSKSLAGRIELVDVMVNPSAQVVRVRAEVANEMEELPPGIQVEMTIYPRTATDNSPARPGRAPNGRSQAAAGQVSDIVIVIRVGTQVADEDLTKLVEKLRAAKVGTVKVEKEKSPDERLDAEIQAPPNALYSSVIKSVQSLQANGIREVSFAAQPSANR